MTLNDSGIDVTCEPISIISLSPDGLLPSISLACEHTMLTEPYQYRYLPPSNRLEETLMSMWVNTHQAMFISTGIAATCVNRVADLLVPDTNIDETISWVDLAVHCRLSSAAYTSLPYLTKLLYEDYVRQSMMKVHPGFSGVSNREAITMECAIRDLSVAHLKLAELDRVKAERLRPHVQRIVDADREWWKFHGKAMGKYVSDPTSLARIDYRNQRDAGSGDTSFSAYRDRVLRQEGAVVDYDAYFGVRRDIPVGVANYKDALMLAIQRSDPYVEKNGVLADHRNQGLKALKTVIELIDNEHKTSAKKAKVQHESIPS